MFDLQIDKKKEKHKKMSSMNKSCEKKQQQRIVKIFYMWMFCITLKGSITKGLRTLITHINYFL
jgi:hypothetical protein